MGDNVIGQKGERVIQILGFICGQDIVSLRATNLYVSVTE